MSGVPYRTMQQIKTKQTADEILADNIQTPITCQALLDSSDKAVFASTDVSGYHNLPVSGKKMHEHLETRLSFAQTISWMPNNIPATHLSSPDGVNVNLKGSTLNAIAKLHDIATQDDQWFRLDLWSITTNQNDGYDYQVSDSNIYNVLRHGFRVNKTGTYKLNCTLHLLPYVNNRYNIAMQFAKKAAALPHVNSTTTSIGAIMPPSASASNFTRVGIPVASGYINMHNSGTKPNESKHIECIVDLNVGDEVALFTTGFGVYGSNTELFAVTKYCSFSIQSM